MEPRYIIFVMPPADVADAEPFDIPEWGYDFACAIARRYRDRGWKACIRARAISEDYDCFQRED